ncbi:MAG: DNA phosphorothioation system sulfurtransferase DndC [Acidimicrobiaceae bacterium]|nr:DNA phosphorothioation system sulfurtransferase DndC [Acidimicrobiaceae bacterium]
MTGTPVEVRSGPTRPGGSAFAERGLRATVAELVERVKALYRADGIPWVVGYSGGKDSTATLQIVWSALQELPAQERSKRVYVITNDTLVENPTVAAWVRRSHHAMDAAVAKQGLPISTHLLSPEVDETFWVNLIGRGYPAPNRRFRWCTERMKINPTTRFIRSLVKDNGEAIIVLGARRAESAARAARIDRWDEQSVRESLSPHNDLASALVYRPIVDWVDDDVWLYLMQMANPWGFDNKQLLTMYRTASPDAECPVVMDTSTPSCGSSRFGCWTCTVVEKDKSMSAMIQNDSEKEWMQPLLDVRDQLADVSEGRNLRDFRRLNGRVSLFNGRHVPGPYTQDGRAHWLRLVLEAQTWVRANGPDDVRDIELITLDQPHRIRHIWITEKHEHEDLLPAIYEKATGSPFPGQARYDDQFPFDAEDLAELRELSRSHLQYELLRELVSVEHRHRVAARRSGIWADIEAAFNRSGFDSTDEAIDLMRALTRGQQAVVAGSPVDFNTTLTEVIEGGPRDERT